MSDLDRVRWHCRRGMLELDIVLSRFVERHLQELASTELGAFTRLLERTDPELLELVMGHAEPVAPDERAILALMRAA